MAVAPQTYAARPPELPNGKGLKPAKPQSTLKIDAVMPIIMDEVVASATSLVA
jgi:hypothetical protein